MVGAERCIIQIWGDVHVEFIISDLKPDNWKQVRQIYLEGLATGQASFEVDAPTWKQWDRSHHRHSRLVVRHEDCVIAWAAIAAVSRRDCYAGVAEVSMYVASSYQNKGIGKRHLQALIDASEINGIWSLYGSTFPENTASIRMQLACGFRVVGRRERIAQQHGIWRDTVISERRSKVVGTDSNLSRDG
jgi:L-amino acid N-acyltransferase YncA